MDIERFKILSIPKIKAGEQTKTVRNALKQHTIEKQDYYEGATKMFEPIVDQQKKNSRENRCKAICAYYPACKKSKISSKWFHKLA